MRSPELTKCELEVMDVVWRLGRATVQDVVDALERPLAYTTVMTTLRILDDKRGVVRKTKRGRAFVYEPLVSRAAVCRSMARDLTRRLFRGSAKSLVLSVIETERMSSADVAELKAAIASLEARA
jgi:predicted transcriptional regulator